MSVLVYPDLAQAILRDLSDFSPIELMSLARVCTSFRNYIKKLLPDYGVKQNLQTLLLLLGFKMEVDEIVKYNLFIFGSTLLSALLMRKGKVVFYPNDLDVFHPTFRLKSKKSVPEKFQELFGKFASRGSSFGGYDVLEGFAVFEQEKMDFVVGLKGKNESNASAVWRHVCRSDIPMCRSIYGKDGFKTQSVDSFFSEQKLVLREFKVLAAVDHYFLHLRKFLTRLIQPITFELPANDVELFQRIVKWLDKEDKLEVVDGKIKVFLS